MGAEDHHDLMQRGELEVSPEAAADARGFRRGLAMMRTAIEFERDRFETSRTLARELLLLIDKYIGQAGQPPLT